MFEEFVPPEATVPIIRGSTVKIRNRKGQPYFIEQIDFRRWLIVGCLKSLVERIDNGIEKRGDELVRSDIDT